MNRQTLHKQTLLARQREMKKRQALLARQREMKDDNPLNRYGTKHELARLWRRSPVTMAKIVAQLDVPFVLLNGKKLYRFAAVEERLREREMTLDDVRRKARR